MISERQALNTCAMRLFALVDQHKRGLPVGCQLYPAWDDADNALRDLNRVREEALKRRRKLSKLTPPPSYHVAETKPVSPNPSQESQK